MDTIAAVSTPPGNGGIGIVRISGPDAFPLSEMFFRPADKSRQVHQLPARMAVYGHVVDPSTGEDLDEALLLRMPGPKSYTAEDVVEFQCHGGRVLLHRILDRILKAGVRMAEPGEFTRRAFLNGRLDLVQAEAVMDMISARTAEAGRNALRQLEGALSEQVGRIRRELLGMLARMEVHFDYPEHDDENLTIQETGQLLQEAEEKLSSLLRGFDRGRMLREGMTAVIAGPPNAGKSSLLNRLAGRYRAIVTELPGTTRDIIEEYVDIRGIPVRLVDTAGLRETGDPVEQQGIAMAAEEIRRADKVVYMMDASAPDFGLSAGLDGVRRILEKGVPPSGMMLVINKSDLSRDAGFAKTAADMLKRLGLPAFPILEISALTGQGMDELVQALIPAGEKADALEDREDVFMTSLRHKECIERAATAVTNAGNALRQGLTLDCAAADVRDALEALGGITGESVGEELQQEIFQRFCIGK